MSTETELCDSLCQAALKLGWTPYPETASWDILLIRENLQVGVQAKMHANTHVLAQALPRNVLVHWSRHRPAAEMQANGPQYRAVLVPHADMEFRGIAALLKLWTFTRSDQDLELLQNLARFQDFNWRPEKPSWIPDVVPGVPAGVPSPVSLTCWKQKALKLLAIAKVRGSVTSADASTLGIRMQVFTDRPSHCQWLRPLGKAGRSTTWGLVGADRSRPDIQHPKEFEFYCSQVEPQLE
jgi:hypothetical protein